MNAADQAIEEIRAVRHRISTEHGHNITKYPASLHAEEKQRAAQLQRGKELLARRKAASLCDTNTQFAPSRRASVRAEGTPGN